jgi:hypothetical protein
LLPQSTYLSSSRALHIFYYSIYVLISHISGVLEPSGCVIRVNYKCIL